MAITCVIVTPPNVIDKRTKGNSTANSNNSVIIRVVDLPNRRATGLIPAIFNRPSESSSFSSEMALEK